MKRKLPKLTPAEYELMDIIWDAQEATITQVLNAYNQRVAPDKQVTRSTIQAQMTRLADKGWLAYTRAKNTFFYSASRKRSRVKGEIIKDISTRIFGGSCAELVTALFETNEISKDEIARLRELINQKDRTL